MRRRVFMTCFILVGFGVGAGGLYGQPEGRVFLPTGDTLAIWEFNNLGLPGETIANGTVVPDFSGNGLDAVVENNGSGNLVIGEGDVNFGDADTTAVLLGGQGPRIVADYPEEFTFDETQSFSLELYVKRDESAGNESWGMLAGTWHSRTDNIGACPDCSFDCRNTEGAWYGWGLMRHGSDNEAFTFNLSPVNPDGSVNGRGCCNEQNPGAVIEFPREEFSYFVASIDRENGMATYYLNTVDGGTVEVASVGLPDTWSLITPPDHDPQRFIMFAGEDDLSCSAYRNAPTGYHLDAVRIQTKAMDFFDVEEAWFSIQDGEATPPEAAENAQAVVNLSKPEVLTGECVELSAANSTVAAGETIEKYEWKIGDGDFEEGAEAVEMTFDDPTGGAGIEIALRITASGGSQSTATSKLIVRPADVAAQIQVRDGLDPVLGPSIRVDVGTVLTLDGTGSTTVVPLDAFSCPLSDQTLIDPTPVASYSWDLNGDGAPESTEPTFDTAPLEEGAFDVVLTVTNEAGTEGRAQIRVTVLPNRQVAERIFGDTPDTLGIWEFNNFEDEGLAIGEPLPNDLIIPDLSGNGLDAVVEANDSRSLVVAAGDPTFGGPSGANLSVLKTGAGGPPRIVVNDEEAFTFDETQSFTLELYVRRDEDVGTESWSILAGTHHTRTANADICVDDCSWDCRNANGAWYGWALWRHAGDNDGFTFNLSPTSSDGTLPNRGCCPNEYNPGPVIVFDEGYNYVAATVDRDQQQARYYLNGLQVGSVDLQPEWAFITPPEHDPQRLMFFTGERDRSCNDYTGAPTGYGIDAARIQLAAMSTEQVEQTWDDIFNARTSPPPESGGAKLLPGDVNFDATVNLTDPVLALGYLFSGEELTECYVTDAGGQTDLSEAGLAVLDWTGDGKHDLTDAVSSLNFQFSGGVAHALGNECTQLPGTCADVCQ